MNRRTLLLALVVVTCAGLPACAHWWTPGLESPEVFLVGIRPLPSENLEQRFEVDLRVLNPNDQDLVVDGVDFSLDVNGTRLSRGVASDEVTLPRFGEAILTLRATTTVFDLFRQVLRAPQVGEFEYELYGRIYLADSPAWLSFERSGVLAPPPEGP